jgi:hypothetical protein
LFEDFGEFLDRLKKAAEMARSEALISDDIVEKLMDWHSSLQEGSMPIGQQLVAPDGELVVYEPGSIVSVRMNGTLVERELLEVTFLNMGESKLLMYRYKNRDDGVSWVPHDQIEPTGQDWKRVFWDPGSNTFSDPEDSDGSF